MISAQIRGGLWAASSYTIIVSVSPSALNTAISSILQLVKPLLSSAALPISRNRTQILRFKGFVPLRQGSSSSLSNLYLSKRERIVGAPSLSPARHKSRRNHPQAVSGKLPPSNTPPTIPCCQISS